MASAESVAMVQMMYVAYYGRPGDPSGVNYWADVLDVAGGQWTDSIINAFGTSQEYTDQFGSLTNEELITNLYQQMFNRAPEPDGLAYYLDLLNGTNDSGNNPDLRQSSLANIALDIANGAQNVDATALEYKIDVATYFTEQVADSGVDYMSDDIDAAQALLAQVTSDPTTVVDTKMSVDTWIADQGGDVYNLTEQTDIATAHVFNAGLVYTPGGDDRINSLQDEDQLTGTDATDDVLNATLGNANDNGGWIITPKLESVEIVNVGFTGSDAFTAVTGLDLQDAAGVVEANITRVSQAIDYAEIGNIQAPLERMSVANSNSNQQGIVEFSFSNGALDGNNTGELELSNVSVQQLNIGQNTSGITASGVSLEGYENLSINSTGGSNVVGTMNLPMDTDTNGTLTITGDADLRIGARVNAVNATNSALLEVANLYVPGTGIAQAGGRLATIDASGLEGDLTLVIDNILDVGKAGTSGVQQDVSIIGGAGDDTFVLYDTVQVADSISGGDGTDTILFYSGSGIQSAAGSIEAASMFVDGSIGNIAVDFSNLPDVVETTVRNISTDVDVFGFAAPVNSADGPATVTLTGMSAAQATGITIQHATTGNNQIQNTTIQAAVASNTASDTLGITIGEGLNTDPRSNFTVVTNLPGNTSTIENVTLIDSDSESNSVELTNFAQHTGTITLSGGLAGTFLNLDVDTAGADVTPVTTGTVFDGGEVQQGLLGLDTDGSAVDYVTGNIWDAGNLATEVRLGAATIDASAEASDVIVRVSTNAASVTGAQSISMGSGNDTVIFDLLSDSRAGLTISDTVSGGEGTDTLVIDGNGVRVSLGASEWTNVSGFETIRTVGNNAPNVGTQIGQNSYNLTLTNDLIDANGTDMLHIVNDNDVNNDVRAVVNSGVGQNTLGTGVEVGVTIDARSLNAQNHFSYNGEEGAWLDLNIDGLYQVGEEVLGGTVDKFILSDANANGANVIDGGAVDNTAATFGANADTLEVRNTATVTAGDLANIQNVGIIAGTNDQAVAQTLVLELNDTIVDAMVDSYHTSSATQVETLAVKMNAAVDVTAPAAGMGLNLDATALTARSAVTIALDNSVPGGAVDSIALGFGNLTVTNFTSGTDTVVLSTSKLGLSLDVDDIGLPIGTDANIDGTNIAFGVAAAAAATDRLIIDTVTNVGQTDIYYDVDGSGAQAQVLIGTFDNTLVAVDFTLIA